MTQAAKDSQKKLVVRIAEKYGVEQERLLNTLKSTAFRQKENVQITNEQMMALLIVAEQYRLNPFTKELYAYPDNGGIVPVVSVDGWIKIINNHPSYDGMDFVHSESLVTPPGATVACHEWIEVSIYRKDRSRPITVREYLDEVYREPFTKNGRDGKPYVTKGPWQTHPKRMLRHKAVIQCARMALGFSGIHDQDEAESIIDMGNAVVVNQSNDIIATASASSAEQLLLEQKQADPFVDALIQRAKKDKAWASAHAFAEQRFSGPVGDYVKQKLRDAEIEQMPAAMENLNTAMDAQAPAEEFDNSDNHNADVGFDPMEQDELPY